VKLLATIIKRKQAEKDAANHISLDAGIAPVLLSALLRETQPVHLRPLAASLAAIASFDPEMDGELQFAINDLVQTAQKLQVLLSENVFCNSQN
jgi:hypothetical protein